MYSGLSIYRYFAEACGIEIKGENKWITLIQNAAREKEKVK
jgi:hypothetical protein